MYEVEPARPDSALAFKNVAGASEGQASQTSFKQCKQATNKATAEQILFKTLFYVSFMTPHGRLVYFSRCTTCVSVREVCALKLLFLKPRE